MKLILTGSFADFDPQVAAPAPPVSTASDQLRTQYRVPTIADPAPPPAGMLACTSCPVRAEARQVVAGMGPRQAPIFFLGQNPGDDEDIVGLPFVGSSGTELNNWLAILGFDRAKVFITNVVKCHTRQNRVPRMSEIQTCSNLWLPEELQALPDVQIVFPLGKPAVVRLLGKSAPPMTPLSVHHIRVRLLNRVLSVFPLPHPAFLLRAPHLGPLLRETLLPRVRETLQQEFPGVYAACQPS